MKQIYLFLITLITYHTAFSQAAQDKKAVTLPNGWKLSPAGKSIPLGDLPLNMAVSASGKWIAVTNNGQGPQSIQLIDAVKNKELDEVSIKRAWYGLAFSRDEKSLYVSAGNDNMIVRYAIKNGRLKLADQYPLAEPWPNPASPTGLTIDDKNNLLYVVTKENNRLYCVDLAKKKVTGEYELPAEAYTCVLAPEKNELYISCWGCDKVLVFDTDKKVIKQTIDAGDNPNEMVIAGKGRYLFVCNANDNSVSVIDLVKYQSIETLNTALFPDALSGSTPNGLALSKDEKTLYIANADNNCLTVFDVSEPGESKAKGFIPTGWYPTNVKVVGQQIWVTNGKGFSSLPNPKGPNPSEKKQKVELHAGDDSEPTGVQYIAAMFKGSMSIIPVPSEAQMKKYSEVVYKNTPYSKNKEKDAGVDKGNPVPGTKDGKSPIKYVFYVIKENRTYDQVLGDMKEGNGDSSLVLFGEKITPNLHAIARQFVLLDNFYVDAEVSADGHAWSMGAYATDFLEKTWPSTYSNRGGITAAAGRREVAWNKNGFIWAACKRNGVSFRSYGEYTTKGKPNIPELKGHICKDFADFNLSIMDTTRFFQWKKDFDSLVAIHAVPQFNTIRMGNDHTEGMKLGKLTPFAHVADNDYGVGMLIDYLSKSSIWNESAIFIIEDDAQNGPDHVDAHRSTAYVAGGFVKRGYVDHTPYSTSAMLRTMELILGIPPMTQYDAAATPMWRSFDTIARPSPFVLHKPNVDLAQRNLIANKWQRKSEGFNFAKEDAIPDIEFSEVIWHAVKGDTPYPGTKRAAFLQVSKEEDAD